MIEEPILDGMGRVDVSLSRGTTKVTCEVSVTSTKDQELGNIHKCIAAGYDLVIIIAKSARQLATLQKHAMAQLAPEEVVATGEATEQTVRGYKVRISRQAVSDAEALARKQAIASVIAKSLSQIKDDA